jgi:hypothetical protein
LTAAVRSNSGASASGTVTFTSGSTTLGVANLAAGNAVLNTTALAQGSDTVNAAYAGNANFAGSSAVVAEVVNLGFAGQGRGHRNHSRCCSSDTKCERFDWRRQSARLIPGGSFKERHSGAAGQLYWSTTESSCKQYPGLPVLEPGELRTMRGGYLEYLHVQSACAQCSRVGSFFESDRSFASVYLLRDGPGLQHLENRVRSAATKMCRLPLGLCWCDSRSGYGCWDVPQYCEWHRSNGS